MLKELLQNWHNTTKKHHYTLKAETQAEGETPQRLRGCGREKTKRLSYLRFKALFYGK